MEKPVIKTITEKWGGRAMPFPAIRGLENAFVYMREGDKAYAVIATGKCDEEWNANLDVIIDSRALQDMLSLDDMLEAQVIFAVDYEDAQMFMPVDVINTLSDDIYHEGNAFLPKEHFKQLVREV